MIRAMIMVVIGLAPVWEVRSISMKSGKDIPGQRLYKGSYFGARRFYKEHKPGAGKTLRFQALISLGTKEGEPVEEGSIVVEETPTETLSKLQTDRVQEDLARQNDTMQRLQNESNVDEEFDDCDKVNCNAAGPLVWDDGSASYVPTCSHCGKMN